MSDHRASYLPPIALTAIEAVAIVAALPEGALIRASELNARLGSDARYLEPSLQKLVRDGILESRRGPIGGYCMKADPAEVTALQVVRAVLGEPAWSPNPISGAIQEAHRDFLGALIIGNLLPLLGQEERAAA